MQRTRLAGRLSGGLRGIEELLPRDGESTRVGRSWLAAELRLKSSSDLHKLWYVCLKERNMLETERLHRRKSQELMPNYERLHKVRRTMARIKHVMWERVLKADKIRRQTALEETKHLLRPLTPEERLRMSQLEVQEVEAELERVRADKRSIRTITRAHKAPRWRMETVKTVRQRDKLGDQIPTEVDPLMELLKQPVEVAKKSKPGDEAAGAASDGASGAPSSAAAASPSQAP